MSTLSEAATRTVTEAPSSLTRGRDPDRISIAAVVINLCFITGAIVVFNLFPERVGTIRSLDQPSSFVPLLAPTFQAYMPLLNTWWALALALNLSHLGYRRWTPWKRWADLGLAVFGMVILARMLAGPPVLAAHPASALPEELLEPFGAAWWLSEIGLSAALAVAGVTALKKVLALIRSGAGLVIVRF